MIAHQATCIAIGGRALMIEGTPGSGKSSLALALIDRGAVLIGDDGVIIAAHDDQLIVHAPAQTRGLIEIRNLGLLTFPVLGSAPVAMVIVLDPKAPRFIEAPESREVLGITVPKLRLTPHDAVLPIKAELALRRYGVATRPLPSATD